jgi:hypothetical protein
MRVGRVGPKRGRTHHPYGFLGITVDTVKLTLEVTPDRVIEISLLVEAWHVANNPPKASKVSQELFTVSAPPKSSK